jgi:hypothetical protein
MGTEQGEGISLPAPVHLSIDWNTQTPSSHLLVHSGNCSADTRSKVALELPSTFMKGDCTYKAAAVAIKFLQSRVELSHVQSSATIWWWEVSEFSAEQTSESRVSKSSVNPFSQSAKLQ